MTKAGPPKGRAARLARFMPSGPATAARTPFVLLVVVLLGGGLIGLLLLNTSLSQGSFKLSELRKRTTELTDEEQALQRDVDARSAPDALERRARELGMVPGGGPAFLEPDGTVRGLPSPAPTPEPDPEPVPGETPHGADPSPAAAPDAPAPNGAVPNAPAPGNAPAPNAPAPDGAVPNGAVPNAPTPGGAQLPSGPDPYAGTPYGATSYARPPHGGPAPAPPAAPHAT
ncbi:FtsB family cell division protein, partial [Streptomyces fradiae]|uniref:FtsB family cell division protein n=1 Tax=Streptomyces fradiae TaxID=1906 RepID=UPI003660984A